ncbi:MAG: hypothetical protein WC748_03685 [Legionellales bacterium]
MPGIDRILQNYPRPYLTDLELDTLLDGTSDSRYSKVKRLLAQGRLLHVRRGLYCLPDKQKTHPYELAQYIYGPSYISLESALSFHQLIPEAVYTITSVTSKRSKEFNTPLGVFSYQHLPLEGFYTEVSLNTENGYSFFMAKPWKAICDYVFCYKKEWDSLLPLEQSLRISRKDLPLLRDEEITLLNEYYHHSRITRFLKGVQYER